MFRFSVIVLTRSRPIFQLVRAVVPAVRYKPKNGVHADETHCPGFLLALSCLLPAQAKAADEIVVNGSTTVLPIMQKVSEAYMAANPNVQIALSGGGSGNGIKALLDGLANIAMSSRDIKGSEKELAARRASIPSVPPSRSTRLFRS